MNTARRLLVVSLLLTACGQSTGLSRDQDSGATADAASADAVTADEPTPPRDAPAREEAALSTDAASTPDAQPSADAATDAAIDEGPRDAASDAAVPVDSAEPAPSFAGIYETILRPKCARCHGGETRARGFWMPDAATAYRELAGVPVRTAWAQFCGRSTSTPPTPPQRVRPLVPEDSMLYFLPDCYVRDAEHSTLTAAERATIRAWILAGAPERSL